MYWKNRHTDGEFQDSHLDVKGSTRREIRQRRKKPFIFYSVREEGVYMCIQDAYFVFLYQFKKYTSKLTDTWQLIVDALSAIDGFEYVTQGDERSFWTAYGRPKRER